MVRSENQVQDGLTKDELLALNRWLVVLIREISGPEVKRDGDMATFTREAIEDAIATVSKDLLWWWKWCRRPYSWDTWQELYRVNPSLIRLVFEAGAEKHLDTLDAPL